jgi:hypothetical protein
LGGLGLGRGPTMVGDDTPTGTACQLNCRHIYGPWGPVCDDFHKVNLSPSLVRRVVDLFAGANWHRKSVFDWRDRA